MNEYVFPIASNSLFSILQIQLFNHRLHNFRDTKEPTSHGFNPGVLQRSDLEMLAENVDDEIFMLLKYGPVAVMNIPEEMYYE